MDFFGSFSLLTSLKMYFPAFARTSAASAAASSSSPRSSLLTFCNDRVNNLGSNLHMSRTNLCSAMRKRGERENKL